MRIAIIVLNLDIGGTQRVSIDLANAFMNANDEVHLITLGKKDILLKPSSEVSVHQFKLHENLKKTVIAIPFLILSKILNLFIRKSLFISKGIMTSLLFKYKFSKLEKEYGKFDLLIFRGRSAYELVWMLKDSRILQAIDNMNVEVLDSYYEKIHAHLTLSSKNIVPISKEIEKKINTLIATGNIKLNSLHTIYGPLNKKHILELAKAYSIDFEEKYIVSIGRLAKVKNYELLIKAYNYAFKNMNLKHKLVLVGDGELRKDLEELVRKYKLEDQVRFTGGLENPYPWLMNADLFITTSFSEGLGMTVLEALACNVKVVSTKSEGGVKEILKGELKEYMVDFSEEKIAKKILDTLDEEKTWDFDKYIGEFLPEKIVNQYKKNYCDKISL